MYFEVHNAKSHVAAGLRHSPWLALIAPRPIGWISTLSPAGIANLAPFSFFNAISSFPPMVMFCANGAHVEGGWKDSFVNARATGEFVHNVATWDLRFAMNDTSATAPRGVDEFDAVGLTKAPSSCVKPYRVLESPVNVECKVVRHLELPGEGAEPSNSMIIGRVVALHIRDDLIVDGRLDIGRLQPLARLGYLDYATVAQPFEMRRPGWPLGK